MLHLMTGFFNAGFYFPGYNGTSILLAIAIGIVFGGIWLTYGNGDSSNDTLFHDCTSYIEIILSDKKRELCKTVVRRKSPILQIHHIY